MSFMLRRLLVVIAGCLVVLAGCSPQPSAAASGSPITLDLPAAVNAIQQKAGTSTLLALQVDHTDKVSVLVDADGRQFEWVRGMVVGPTRASQDSGLLDPIAWSAATFDIGAVRAKLRPLLKGNPATISIGQARGSGKVVLAASLGQFGYSMTMPDMTPIKPIDTSTEQGFRDIYQELRPTCGAKVRGFEVSLKAAGCVALADGKVTTWARPSLGLASIARQDPAQSYDAEYAIDYATIDPAALFKAQQAVAKALGNPEGATFTTKIGMTTKSQGTVIDVVASQSGSPSRAFTCKPDGTACAER